MYYISEADVKKCITMAEAVKVVKEAFAQLSSGKADVPQRSFVKVPEYDGATLFMPAFVPASGGSGVKVVSVYPHNVDRGLPVVNAAVLLVEKATGRVEALIEGTYLTALRTGAASGAATDLLARPDAETVAIFGAGAQGRAQLAGVCAVRQIKKIWVYDTDRNAAERFVGEVKGNPAFPEEIHIAGSSSEAVREADIICTATTSQRPVFDGNDVKAGTHVNAIGAYTPAMREVDIVALSPEKIVVDSRSACFAEAGDLIIPLKKKLIPGPEDWVELGEIISGDVDLARKPGDKTCFKSVGTAVQDISVGRVVLNSALRMGIIEERGRDE